MPRKFNSYEALKAYISKARWPDKGRAIHSSCRGYIDPHEEKIHLVGGYGNWVTVGSKCKRRHWLFHEIVDSEHVMAVVTPDNLLEIRWTGDQIRGLQMCLSTLVESYLSAKLSCVRKRTGVYHLENHTGLKYPNFWGPAYRTGDGKQNNELFWQDYNKVRAQADKAFIAPGLKVHMRTGRLTCKPKDPDDRPVNKEKRKEWLKKVRVLDKSVRSKILLGVGGYAMDAGNERGEVHAQLRAIRGKLSDGRSLEATILKRALDDGNASYELALLVQVQYTFARGSWRLRDNTYKDTVLKDATHATIYHCYKMLLKEQSRPLRIEYGVFE